MRGLARQFGGGICVPAVMAGSRGQRLSVSFRLPLALALPLPLPLPYQASPHRALPYYSCNSVLWLMLTYDELFY